MPIPATLALLVVACRHPAPPEPAPAAPSTPILPAPEAPFYATGRSEPRDPVVALLVSRGALPWEEALAGAAAGLLLEPEVPVRLETARLAAVRAGYPFPVVGILRGSVPADEVPGDLASAVRQQMAPGDQVGVVRARRGAEDAWLALVGRPRAALPPLARERARGDTLELEAGSWLTWALVSPTGRVVRGEVPARPVLDEAGEWWLEVRDPRAHGEGALVAGIPFYVDTPTPRGSLLPLPGEAPDSPSAALDEVAELLDLVREAHQLPPLTADRALDTLAAWPLEQALAGTWSAEQGAARLRAAGFVGGPAAQVHCRAPSVPLCFEALLTSVEGRAALLEPRHRAWGAAVQARTDGVALVLNLASE